MERLSCEVARDLLRCVPTAHNLEALDIDEDENPITHNRNKEVNRIALVCCAWHQIAVTKPAASLQRMVTVTGGGGRLSRLLASELEWWTAVECINATDAEVMQVVIGRPGLTTLRVRDCENLTDASIKVVAKGCPKLTTLRVRYCENLTDASIKAVAKGCPKLTTLQVIDCENLTDASIKAVANGCPKLTSLSVDGCDKLTDVSIVAVANGCPKLTSLSVDGCKNLTDASFKAVANGCPELTTLQVSNGENLTNASILAVVEGCPGLTSIDLHGCRNLPRICCGFWANYLKYKIDARTTKSEHYRMVHEIPLCMAIFRAQLTQQIEYDALLATYTAALEAFRVAMIAATVGEVPSTGAIYAARDALAMFRGANLNFEPNAVWSAFCKRPFIPRRRIQ